jgi:cysteinyl-tRNA synthetase
MTEQAAAIKIYNTLSRKKEAFTPMATNQVSMYVCGPTVYSKAHVGHAMSALVFDIIRRYLEFRGYRVKHVMNFTDVDDRIILRANQEKIDPFALAERYVADYQQNLVDLNVLPATINPRATQEMEQIQTMISGLIEKNAAYPVDGDVYFRVTRDKDYGKLSWRKLSDMQAGARIEIDERKEHPMDFALWKAAKPGEPAWPSPWGKGRPGWHIECSAMNLHHLGEQIDIHGGGNDLIFPHHENEMAQTETFTGKPFARYWVHNGMLQLGGEKMSKSTGNLVTIEEFLSKHAADVMRLLVLNGSYRGPLTFNDEVIEQAERAVERLRTALRPAPVVQGDAPAASLATLGEQMTRTRTGFTESMDDDFNSAGALGYLFELARTINQARADGAAEASLNPAQNLLRDLCHVLGMTLAEPAQAASQAEPFINLLLDLRRELRTQKQWSTADLVRNRLIDLGVTLEDSKDGTTWRWAKA